MQQRLYYIDIRTTDGSFAQFKEEIERTNFKEHKYILSSMPEVQIARRTFTPLYINKGTYYIHKCLLITTKEGKIEDFIYKVAKR
jgi:hypothetical protein